MLLYVHRGYVGVSGLKRKLDQGGDAIWRDEEAEKSNVGLIRPSHDAWGIKKVILVNAWSFFLDDAIAPSIPNIVHPLSTSLSPPLTI